MRFSAALLSLLFGVSCASNATQGASCYGFSPCGGDITGTWSVTQTCVVRSGSPAACPDEKISLAPSLWGTLTFRADKTLQLDFTIASTEDVSYPKSCLGGVDCQALQGQLQSSGDTTTCTDAISACQCRTTTGPESVTGTGTYTTVGTTLTVKNSTGTTTAEAYCVQADTLMYQGTAPDGTTSTVVATRSK